MYVKKVVIGTRQVPPDQEPEPRGSIDTFIKSGDHAWIGLRVSIRRLFIVPAGHYTCSDTFTDLFLAG